MEPKRVVIKRERRVVTYAELWHTSRCLLDVIQVRHEGGFHQCMASLVFTAFTFEAYLNHLGEKVFRSWEALQRLSPREKLDVLAERLGVEIDYGRRPWQIMKELFVFRNDIAHGKSIVVRQEITVPAESSEASLREFAKTRWEDFCTPENAERARVDVQEMVQMLFQAAKIEGERPFQLGSQSATAVP